MDKVNYIEYKGKRILYIDFSLCSIEEVFKIMKKIKQVISLEPKDSVLTLTNVKDAHYNAEVVQGLKDLVVFDKPYVKKSTVIGVGANHKVIYNSIMKFAERHILISENMQAAKDWLIDRRCYARLPENCNVEYTIEGSNVNGKGIMNNIGIGGICFVTDKNIEQRAMLLLKLNLDETTNTSIEAKGIVAWTSNILAQDKDMPFSIGIRFIDISATDRQVLFHYLFKRFEGDSQNSPIK